MVWLIHIAAWLLMIFSGYMLGCYVSKMQHWIVGMESRPSMQGLLIWTIPGLIGYVILSHGARTYMNTEIFIALVASWFLCSFVEARTSKVRKCIIYGAEQAPTESLQDYTERLKWIAATLPHSNEDSPPPLPKED